MQWRFDLLKSKRWHEKKGKKEGKAREKISRCLRGISKKVENKN